MKHLAFLLFLLLLAFIALTSCKKKDDNTNKPTPVLSRTLKYEVSGNFTGTIYASYTTAGGGANNELISSIPWVKEITFASNVSAANIVLSGSSGVAGQSVTLIIKRGTSHVSTTVMTADATGNFSQAAPVVVF